MTVDSAGHADLDFFGLARQLSLLDESQADDLAKRSQETDTPPAQVAQQAGLLDASQIDIIQTLLHPTETIPGYEIKAVVGRGGMGVVYRAVQLNLNREVALKTILLSRMADRSVASRFEQEAQTVGRLRHPNIVAAYDFGRHEGRVFLAMEFVDGEDAESLIKRQTRLDERTARSIARQTAAGLSHAAAHDIVHRDIKPANLLLVDAPEGFALPPGVPMVKIADFGLAFLSGDAQVHTRLTAEASTVGSPHYMAPEQLADGAVDHRADIYALGASVHHMLSGQPPFADLSLAQIVTRKLSGNLTPLDEVCPDVSPEMCRLVQRMMARDPADRFATYGELLDAIDALEHVGTMTEKLPAVGTDGGGTVTTGLANSPLDVAATQTMPVAGEETYSFETSPVNVKPRWWKSHEGVLTLLIVAMLLASWGFYWSRSLPEYAAIVRVPMESTGWSTALFYGISTKGWLILSGNWVAGQNDEGGAVLAGTEGVTSRPLFLRQDADGRNVAPVYYRVEFVVQPNAAAAVAVHFALEPREGRDGERAVVQLTEDGIAIGRQASNQAALEDASERLPLAQPWPSRHRVIVERLPTGWFITVDAKELPPVPFRADGELPEFRLSATGGPAWFSDIIIEELSPMNDETAKP